MNSGRIRGRIRLCCGTDVTAPSGNQRHDDQHHGAGGPSLRGRNTSIPEELNDGLHEVLPSLLLNRQVHQDPNRRHRGVHEHQAGR